MTKPVILAVDDDPEVLGAVERDLKQRYRADYRVLPARSGAAGARDGAGAEAPRHAGRAVPGRSAHAGHDRHAVPARDAEAASRTRKRVLLTAYADSEAAIAAINDVGLDHYLMKPWDPPEQRLYPVLDDLLADWSAQRARAVRGRPRRRLALVAAQLRHARLPVAQPDSVPVDRRRAGRADARAGAVGQRRRSGAAAGRAAGRRHACSRCRRTRSWPAKVGLQTAPTRPFYDLVDHRRRPGRAGVRGLRRVGRAEGRCSSSRTRPAARRARAR